MTVATAAPGIGDRSAMPAALVNACFVLFVVNVSAFLALSVSHAWIFDAQGRGIPTDFINVWSAGKLALDGHPALAWDWDIQKQIQVAVPVVLANTMVGQNGFLTAALIGGTLYLLPTRPILSGICLGLLSYKPQYGVLFPLALIAGAYWTAFTSAAIVTIAIAVISWLAFGSDSWHAFFHWMPTFSQAFFTEGRATW